MSETPEDLKDRIKEALKYYNTYDVSAQEAA